MEQLQENISNQVEGSPAPELSPGRVLREARERLGLSVMEVANQIKFATRQIEALEADNYRLLQGATFQRGFVRSYAKILHLDAQPLLDQLPVDKQALPLQKPAPVAMRFPAMLHTRRQNLIWSGAALLLAFAVVIFGIWNSSTPRSQSELARSQSKAGRVQTPVALPEEIKAISDLPVQEEHVASSVLDVPKLKSATSIEQSPLPDAKKQVSQVAPQVKPKSSEIQSESSNTDIPKADKPKTVKPMAVTSGKRSSLRLVFGEESWTEIKDKNGKIISSQVNQPSSELRLEGHPPFTMLIGHALSVHLYQDDEEVDLTPYINKYSEVAHLTLE